MGMCNGTPEDKRDRKVDEKINKEMHAEKTMEAKVVKLLLLGTGESGKSTIFKQAQLVWDTGFTDHEKATYRHVVRRNVVESMQALLAGAVRFNFKLSSVAAEESAKFLLNLDPLSADFWVPEVVGHIKTLWKEDAVRQTFEHRSRIQVLDSASYLFDNVQRIGEPHFTPNPDDILKARLRTSGIVERTFKVQGVQFKIIDVGGQRNERRKWIHCFEGVTAVIFVAAVNEYDQMLYEEEKENRMAESMKVFSNICENKFFTRTPIILFFNKDDLFREKITKVPLKTFFPDFPGPDTYEVAKRFVQQKYLDLAGPQRDVYPHFTCATDTSNMTVVFDAVRRFILKQNLEKLGLA